MPVLPPPPDLPAPPDPVPAPDGPAAPPIALRAAPTAFALVLASALVGGWFSVWGLDNVNHCNDPSLTPEEDCGLGFAVLLPLAWAFSAVICLALGGVGCTRLSRRATWAVCLVAAALIWAADLGALTAYRPRT